ncbi:signal transduction histidine kinase [Acidovorax sp. 93]|jgi:signal transduction histidine kinase|uniref:HAMP domain-containing sensor histidine kinase n=1 Tax=Acidovorax TaxID=12916 RepID=UPI0008AEC380|nr:MULTISPECIES: HAMP domain-containing sensor histidine kinase [unclassified Acidovorax]OGA60286.1 MAG: two-component sensor histidine kinase [Burkholderiales bacterium RIFCSPHIGHO2_01_FULL_64_960]OGA85706.1 MAG: two-component sensor histidine kinase [Burkholderiales bacterium GWA2_64_37]HCE94467.1 two-component sensor histidine kinase [Acidovorax sp.]MBV7460238.1 HAMP domain-containing histidine kinase [Acidovorax sp. sif0632]MBV7465263.1 HAMP domain-containing histidine kinase [Acidovorax s
MKPSDSQLGHDPACPWHRRARDAVGYSLRIRLVLVFMALAVTVAVVFMGGMQKVVALGWKEAARPLLMDYVDRLTAEIGSPPSIERAQAIADRLPVTLRIDGPQIHWDSHPDRPRPDWMSDKVQRQDHWSRDDTGYRLLQRTTADGHHIEFGLNALSWDKRPRIAWGTLTVLLLLTALAFVYVRHLLRPLDDIRHGARRFGNGDFGEPIPVRHAHRPDELGQLAGTINTMGEDIHQMLEAKRALLLAMSHELRSPLTRARLNTELLPESPDVLAQRAALMRDLGEMARLITDLLESERLAGRHAALHREPTDLAELAREVVAELEVRHPGATAITLLVPGTLPTCMLDRSRVRLLMRNLLDNSLRHNDPAAQPPQIELRMNEGVVEIEVRDHGPGVPPAHLPHLAQAFYRPDTARQRTTGGVGLGLYLCRLVTQAHGGTLLVRNAEPGLRVTARLPCPDGAAQATAGAPG